MKRSSKKSPLKLAPLRVPGQSIDAQLDDLRYDEMLSPILLAGLMVLTAMLEWLRYFTDSKLNPLPFTIVAIMAIGYAIFRVRRGDARAQQLKLGRSGERAVGQYLEWFRTKGFFVFHDVPNGDANIDHLLIGTRGIYTIETKTISKPARGDAHVLVKDGKILADGYLIERDPIVQAKAQARWVHNFLAQSQFKAFVQPVVVFPGWFVEPFDMKAVGVWVLEPKALDKFIENEAEALTHDEVRAMASALASYIRSQSNL